MAYWRDDSRSVKWTKEGKLVYADEAERDSILISLKKKLRELIIAKPTDPRALYEVCKEISSRQKEVQI